MQQEIEVNENEGLETSNIHFRWLDGIRQKLDNIENMERLAREGCLSLIEYLDIPLGSQGIILPDIQYKNLRFMVFELKVLIDCLEPIIKDKIENYRLTLKPIIENIDNRSLFMKERKLNGNLIGYQMLPFFNQSYNYLSNLKSSIIKDIGFILFIKGDEKKRW